MSADESGHQQHERRSVHIFATSFCCLVWQHIFKTHLCLLCFLIKFSLSNLQVTMEFGLDKRAQTLQGLAFPLQEEAKAALRQLKQKRINYIQLVRQVSWGLGGGGWGGGFKSNNVVVWDTQVLERVCWWKWCGASCVAEAGRGEGDHRAGSHQTYRDSGASAPDPHWFPSIPLLHLQTLLPGSAAGGTGSVDTGVKTCLGFQSFSIHLRSKVESAPLNKLTTNDYIYIYTRD